MRPSTMTFTVVGVASLEQAASASASRPTTNAERNVGLIVVPSSCDGPSYGSTAAFSSNAPHLEVLKVSTVISRRPRTPRAVLGMSEVAVPARHLRLSLLQARARATGTHLPLTRSTLPLFTSRTVLICVLAEQVSTVSPVAGHLTRK